MRTGLFLAICVCTACAKIEELELPPPSFTVQQDGAGFTVTNPRFSMHFADGGAAAMHFPDVLTIEDSPNVLGPEEACAGEQLVGLAMFPAFVTAPSMSLPPFDSNFEFPAELNSPGINTEGPHIVQIGLTYAVDYSCSSGERFEGRTAFTLFPNGRIVRHDFDLRPSSNVVTAANQTCGCGNAGGGPLAFTSFWTFDGAGGHMVQRNGSPVTFNNNPPVADQNGPFDGLCTMYPNHAIGVSYAGRTSRARNNVNSTLNLSNFAHVFDFNFDPVLEPVVMEGPTDPEDVLYDVTSAIQIAFEDDLDDADCSKVLEGLSEPAVQVGDVELDAADADGIYNDFVEHDDDFVIRSLEGLPPGFTLRTTIPSGVVKFTRDPPLPDDRPVALFQLDSSEPGARVFLLYFPDALGPDETITIEVL